MIVCIRDYNNLNSLGTGLAHTPILNTSAFVTYTFYMYAEKWPPMKFSIKKEINIFFDPTNIQAIQLITSLLHVFSLQLSIFFIQLFFWTLQLLNFWFLIQLTIIITATQQENST